MRSNARKQAHNRSIKSRLHTLEKSYLQLLGAGKKDEAIKTLADKLREIKDRGEGNKVAFATSCSDGVIGLAAVLAGCDSPDEKRGYERYIPSPEVARSSLAASLRAWQARKRKTRGIASKENARPRSTPASITLPLWASNAARRSASVSPELTPLTTSTEPILGSWIGQERPRSHAAC